MNLADEARSSPAIRAETTIAQVQATFAAKTLTCHDLVMYYLHRIKLYDSSLHSILETNPDAVSIAKFSRRAVSPKADQSALCIASRWC